MNKLATSGLLAGAVASAVLWTSGALAADLRTASRVSYIPAPVVNWTGLYIGGHLGYGQGKVSAADPTTPGSNINTTMKGFLGGGQIGYNYQAGATVFGIEADFSGGNADGTTVLFAPDGDIVSGSSRNRWTSLLTARLGYAEGNALLYVKGGAAFGGFRYTAANLTDNESSSAKYKRSGWTIGAGLEYALSGGWSVRGEYDYLSFGKHNVTFTDATGASDVAKIRNKIHQVKVGLNYRFGSY